MSALSYMRRIEFSTGLVLQREGSAWRFRDPEWIKTGGNGRSWLALTPFGSLEDALAAAERVLPILERAFRAHLDRSSADQAYYTEAMAAIRDAVRAES